MRLCNSERGGMTACDLPHAHGGDHRHYHRTPRNPGGRPRSTDPRKLRAVRFSDAEWAEVRRAADATGRSLSEFVRKGASDLAAWEIAKLD